MYVCELEEKKINLSYVWNMYGCSSFKLLTKSDVWYMYVFELKEKNESFLCIKYVWAHIL